MKPPPMFRRVTVTILLPEDDYQAARHQLGKKQLLVPTGCATVTAIDRIAATVIHAADSITPTRQG